VPGGRARGIESEDDRLAVDPVTEGRNAFNLILVKLGRRDHTEKELARALGRKGFSEEASLSALGRAKREGLVNDERLAGALARSTARSGTRGPRRVVATLRNKGVAKETAQTAAKEAFTESEDGETRLVAFAERLLRRAKGETLKHKRIKVMRFLIGRGFELSEARRVVRLAENALMTENTPHDEGADQ
jgi:SOS response regulatory protein OraA/RecX